MTVTHHEGTPPGRVLIALRSGKGFGQRAMAAAFGVDQAMVSRYENDRTAIPRPIYKQAANVLGQRRDGELPEPEPDEERPSWVLCFADPKSGAFVPVTDARRRLVVLLDPDLAMASAGALTDLCGLHAFALPVWRSWLEGIRGVVIGGGHQLVDASAAADFLASSLRALVKDRGTAATTEELAAMVAERVEVPA